MLCAPVGVGYALAFAIAPHMNTDWLNQQYENESDGEEEQSEDESDGEEEQCAGESDGEEEQCAGKSDGEEEQCADESDGEEEQCIDPTNEIVVTEQADSEDVTHISNNEEAGNVLRRMSKRMQLVFFQLLLTYGETHPLDNHKMRELLASIATQCCRDEAALPVHEQERHTTPKQKAQAALQAAAQAEVDRKTIAAMSISVLPADQDRMHQEACDDAQARVKVALESIDAAERVLGRTHELLIAVLKSARAIMLPMPMENTPPSVQLLAQRAAAALQLVMQTLIDGLEKHKRKAIKLVAKNLRDIIMLCCRAQADIKDRSGFLAMAAQAFKTTCISKDLRSQLMLSYKKDLKNQKCGFPSNAAYAKNRNGTRSPRHKKDKASDDTHLASTSQEQGDPSSSYCAAATTSSSCTVASAAATSGSACAAVGSMLVEPTIYQDRQKGNGGGKCACYESMTADQEASWQANDEPWAECWATFPNDAAPGQPSLADETSADPCSACRYQYRQYLMFLKQQAAQYYQASCYCMRQSIWHAEEYQKLATLHSYSQGQVHAARTYTAYTAYSSAAADALSRTAAAASSPPAATPFSSSAAAASSSSPAATPAEELLDFWMDSRMEGETNPSPNNTQHATDDEL